MKIKGNEFAQNSLMRSQVKNTNQRIICEHLVQILSKIKGMTAERAMKIAMKEMPSFWEGKRWKNCTLPAMKDFKMWEIVRWFGQHRSQLLEIFKHSGYEQN